MEKEIAEIIEKLGEVPKDTWIDTVKAFITATYVKGFEDGRKAVAEVVNSHWCEDCISFDYGKHWCSKWNGKTIADGTCHNWDGAKCNG